MRILARIFAGLTIVALAAGCLVAWIHYEFERPGPLAEEVTVTVPRGAGLAGIAQALSEAGVVRHRQLFGIGVRLSGHERALSFGEYRFAVKVSGSEVMEQLRQADIVQHFITIPEGLTSREIVTLLEAEGGLEGSVDALPRQGTLLPETYAYTAGHTRAELIDSMRAQLDELAPALWQARASDLPLADIDEAMVLASIVEKETGTAEERPLVASVFINRVREGMPLQSDPTVIFAITEGNGPLGHPLTRAEINRTESPYNTYRNAGLPPGPIANPGRAAIEAVLNPAETNYLYFVADGTGGHAFAETYAEHRRNVQAYREWQRANPD